MLTNAYQQLEREIRTLYPDLYSDDETQNRIFHPDSYQSVAVEATNHPVILLYYPALLRSDSFNEWRCQVDFCARRQSQGAELADVLLTEVQYRPEKSQFNHEPNEIVIAGQGFTRVRVQFTMQTRRVQ